MMYSDHAVLLRNQCFVNTIVSIPCQMLMDVKISAGQGVSEIIDGTRI